MTRLVPVEDLQRGDRVVLPRGRRVTVERVDEYDDALVVRWARIDPEHPDGVQLGSLRGVPRGHRWEVVAA